MLLDNVVVVEQPVGCRPDVYILGCGIGETLVRVVEDLSRSSEPGKQRRASPATPLDQPLSSGVGSCPLGEVFGAEQLAADWSGEQVLAALGRRREIIREEARRAWSGERDGSGGPRRGAEWARRKLVDRGSDPEGGGAGTEAPAPYPEFLSDHATLALNPNCSLMKSMKGP